MTEAVARVRAGLEMFEAGACTALQLAKGLRKYADQLEVAAAGPKAEETKRKVERVFEAWRAAMGKGSAKLTRDRRAKVEARLREGYSVEEMIVAVRNCAASAWHRGDNDRQTAYDDLTLIMRDGSHLERFRDMGPDASPTATGTQPLLPLAPSERNMGYKGPSW